MVAHLSWATWAIRSRSPICLERSERITHSHSFDLSEMSEWANSQPCLFHLLMPKSETLPLLFAHSLFFKEQINRFSLVALYKRETLSHSLRLSMTKEPLERFAPATVSDSQRSLMTKEQRERFAQVTYDKRATEALRYFSQANCSFALSLTKDKQIAWKTDEQIPNPGAD